MQQNIEQIIVALILIVVVKPFVVTLLVIKMNDTLSNMKELSTKNDAKGTMKLLPI